MPEAYRRLIKAADLISALNHCQRETYMGNREFTEALLDIRARLDAYPDMAVMERCQPSYRASLEGQLRDAARDE
jgi:hypothetical protein